MFDNLSILKGASKTFSISRFDTESDCPNICYVRVSQFGTEPASAFSGNGFIVVKCSDPCHQYPSGETTRLPRGCFARDIGERSCGSARGLYVVFDRAVEWVR